MWPMTWDDVCEWCLFGSFVSWVGLQVVYEADPVGAGLIVSLGSLGFGYLSYEGYQGLLELIDRRIIYHHLPINLNRSYHTSIVRHDSQSRDF